MRVASASFRLLALLSATLCVPALAQEPAATSGTAPAAESPATSTPASNAPAAAPAPATPVSASAAAPQTAEEAFNTRVKTLEEQVVDLKEKIYRSKARLLLLQETVLGGDLSTGARAVIFHKNEMGSAFYLEQVVYSLDGAPIFTQTDNNGDLDKRKELEIFNGRIVPGQHQLNVRLTYRGSGYGVFSYLEGYKFKVQSSYTFNAEAGKVSTVSAVGVEKGGLTTDLQDRPDVRYSIEVSRDQGKKAPSTATPEGPAPATSSTEPK